MSSFLLRIRNARQVVQVCANGEQFKAGAAQNELAVLEHGSIIVDLQGKIAAVGSDGDVAQWVDRQPQPVSFEKELDGSAFCVLPGFVDGHTHPVWSGSRVGEFAMKLAGATYMQVHESGGGINCSVRATRASSEDELAQLLHTRLDRMLRSGTTLIEAKSGYGLETATELKMLRVLHNAKKNHPVEIVANFLGGHSVPEGMSAAEATADIVNNQIPAVAQAIQDGTISPEFIDVFCEKGVFEHEDTRRILAAGAQAGLKINFHGDEIHPMQSGTLAADLHAHAISHCEMLTPSDIAAMASHTPIPIFAVLLPTTKYILKLPSPPAREMISAGVPVALGSDFNPNAHCLSMPMTMNMACVLFGMTMNEALVGATINAAASIDRAATHGSIEVGKHADFVLLRASQWEHVVYEMVDPPIEFVVKRGRFYPSMRSLEMLSRRRVLLSAALLLRASVTPLDSSVRTFAAMMQSSTQLRVTRSAKIKRGAQELLCVPTVTITHIDLDVKSEERMSGAASKKPRTTKEQSSTAVVTAAAKSPVRKATKKIPSAKDTASRVKREAPMHWEEMLRIIQERSEERDTTSADAVGCAFYIYSEDKYEPHIWRFQMLVLGMISSLTKDRINGEAVGRLINREGGLTVQSMVDIDEEELAQLVYPAGLYRNKAKHIKKTALVLKKRAETLGADVIDIPETYDEVIALPGIGPKIANLVMTVAWHQVRGVCVDSHVHRISNRLGWVDTWNTKNPKIQDPTKTAQELEDWLPREHWGPINVQVVSFGQTFCKAVAPKCKQCPLSHLCPSANSSAI